MTSGSEAPGDNNVMYCLAAFAFASGTAQNRRITLPVC
jgi:hypothetical protein